MEADRVRIVRVASPSARGETGAVFRAIVHIVVWSALLIGVERAAARPAGDDTAASSGMGYQVSTPFRDLAAPDQRIYRTLRAAEGDLEDTRSSTGQWPSVAALAARALPPFSPDPIDKGGYQWSLLRDRTVASYVGVPTDASRPTFLLTFLEPEPGTAKDPTAPTDEVHHKLADGTMLHVGIWVAPGPQTLTAPLAAPAVQDGWRRVTLGE